MNSKINNQNNNNKLITWKRNKLYSAIQETFEKVDWIIDISGIVRETEEILNGNDKVKKEQLLHDYIQDKLEKNQTETLELWLADHPEIIKSLELDIMLAQWMKDLYKN